MKWRGREREGERETERETDRREGRKKRGETERPKRKEENTDTDPKTLVLLREPLSRSSIPSTSRRGRCAARLHGKLCEKLAQDTSTRPPSGGFFVIPDDMGDEVPTDQLSHNHCDCTDCSKPHCRFRVCFVLLVSTLVTRRPRRVPSTMSTSPSSSTRASLVFHLSRHISPSHPPRTGG